MPIVLTKKQNAVSSEESKPSSDRALTFAKQMLVRKKAIEKQMVEDDKNNQELQAALAELRATKAKEQHGATTVGLCCR